MYTPRSVKRSLKMAVEDGFRVTGCFLPVLYQIFQLSVEYL